MTLKARDSEIERISIPNGEAFYVSPNGSDSNPGNRRNPLLTVTAALAKCVHLRGDIITLGPGTYTENVVINKAGVRIKGCSGSRVADSTVITCASGVVITIAAAYCELSSFEVFGPSGGAACIKTDDTNWMSGVPFTGSGGLLRDLHIAGPAGGSGIGLWMYGAQSWRGERLWIQGANVAIGMAKGVALPPSQLHFDDVSIDQCTTADLAMLGDGGSTSPGDTQLFHSTFKNFLFRGNTVTKYINLGTTAASSSLITDAYFRRAAASLVVLPAGVLLFGRDETGFLNIVGA